MNSCPGPEVKTYSYGTNLHRLIKDLFSKGYLDEDLDIQRHLLSEETDEDKKRLLEGTYNDIFMIFDLDPQDSNVDFEKIRKMLDFFDDSADDEKLYINYPMLESYKHMKSYDTKDFENSTVKMSDISKYKKIGFYNISCGIGQRSRLIIDHAHTHLCAPKGAVRHLRRRAKDAPR